MSPIWPFVVVLNWIGPVVVLNRIGPFVVLNQIGAFVVVLNLIGPFVVALNQIWSFVVLSHIWPFVVVLNQIWPFVVVLNQIGPFVAVLNRPELLDVKAVLLMPVSYQASLTDLKDKKLFQSFQRPLVVGGIANKCYVDGPELKDSLQFFRCPPAEQLADGDQSASESVYVFHCLLRLILGSFRMAYD